MLPKSRSATRGRANTRPQPIDPAEQATAAGRWSGYLFMTRAAAFERHTRSCQHCAPGSDLAASFGPCPVAMRIAQKADAARDCFERLARGPEQLAAPSGTLF